MQNLNLTEFTSVTIIDAIEEIVFHNSLLHSHRHQFVLFNLRQSPPHPPLDELDVGGFFWTTGGGLPIPCA